jgi:non-specific serine/threonine protein kinase
VDHDEVVEFAEELEVAERGGAALGPVDQVVGLAPVRGVVAAGELAVPVPLALSSGNGHAYQAALKQAHQTMQTADVTARKYGMPHLAACSKVQGGSPQSPPPAQVAGGWRLGHDSPVAVQQVHAAVLNGRIWVAGGLLDEQDATAKTEFYDPTIDTWNPGPPLPVPLHHAMMVTYRNTVVVIGGFEPQGGSVLGATSARVLFLNPAQNAWTDGPALHFARAAGAAAVVGNKIVVVGGRTAGSEKPVVPTEIFDGASWHDAAGIPIVGDHLAAASDGTYLYVAGGRHITVTSNTAAVQRFDPATGQWTRLPPMPAAASDLGAAVIDGQLITVGGEGPASVLSTVRAYNLATSTWSSLPNLAAARHGAAVTAIGNTLYTLDGAAQPGHTASTPTVQILHFGK